MSFGVFSTRGTRRAVTLIGVLASAGLVASCMADPGDAPVVEDPPQQVDQDGATEPETPTNEIVFGISNFVEGFNPHIASDATMLTEIIADLTLPSAFVRSEDDPEELELNESLIDSATVLDADGVAMADQTAADPGVKTIRYRINSGAQWSDGTPISGSDFTYLRDGIVTTPGVKDSAAYEMISRINVSGGGRIVDVVVDGPLPQWRELFGNLLPSHLLRPSGDTFGEVLENSMVASGNRYQVQSIDMGRGEIRLVRNDRYWGAEPPVTETILLVPENGPVSGMERLRTGTLQGVHVRPQEASARAYSLVPGAVAVESTQPRVLSLQVNDASPVLSDVAVRHSVLGTIDVEEVAVIATGRSTDLSIPEPRPGTLGDSDAPVAEPLTVAVTGDGTARSAVQVIVTQLNDAGIDAEVVTGSAQDIAGSLLPYGEADLVVSWVDQPKTVLDMTDRFGCPTASRISTAPEDAAEVLEAPPARGSNLSGLCDARVEELLVQHQGDLQIPQELDEAVGGAAVELPLMEDTYLTVVGPDISIGEFADVSQWPLSPESGVFFTAAQWDRIVREEEVNDGE